MNVGDLIEYLKTQDPNDSVIFTFDGEKLEIDSDDIESLMYPSMYYGFYIDIDEIHEKMIHW